MAHELRDVVVVLPGIMGSALRKGNDDVWKMSGGTLLKGITSLGRSITGLRLPDGIGDDHPGDGVVATGLMSDLHVIPGIWTVTIGYDRMLGWLRSTFATVEADPAHPERVANLIAFPYDWRLSNRYNAKVLGDVVEPALERFRAQPGHADAKVVFIGHSMGGLVARYYVECLGGHAITRKLVTLGTPYRGSLNAVDQLVNGVRKGLGPLSINLTPFARSLPSTYQLLPEYACITTPGADGVDVLKKTTDVSLPGLSTAMVADAMAFHDQMDTAAADHLGAYDRHPILGRSHPTSTTARIDGDRAVTSRTMTFVDEASGRTVTFEGGDGTVPRLAAVPKGVPDDSPIIRYIDDKHGGLPANQAALDELEGVLTGSGLVAKGMQSPFGLVVEDILVAGEPVGLVAESPDETLLLGARLVPSGQPPSSSAVAVPYVADHGRYEASFDDVDPGAYELQVGWREWAEGPLLDVVTAPLVVLDPTSLT